MSEPEVDVEAIVHLDFPTPCTIRVGREVTWFGFTRRLRVSPRCDHPAEWAMRCVCCGAAGMVCGQHRAQILLDKFSTCMSCGATGPVERVLAFTPLKPSR